MNNLSEDELRLLIKLTKVKQFIKGPLCVESTDDRDIDIALNYNVPGAGSPILVAHCCGSSTHEDQDDFFTLKQAQQTTKLFVEMFNSLESLLQTIDSLRESLRHASCKTK